MIPKHSKGNGFRGLCDYLLGGGKDNQPGRAEIIGGNMASSDARGLAAEFGAIDRRDAKKPVLHISLSAVHGEHLSDSKWQEIAHAYMNKIGIVDHGNHQHVIVRHDDKVHSHIHIVINRRGLDGTLARDQKNDYEIGRRAAREIETEFGLQPGEQRPQADLGLIAEIRAKVTAARDASRGQGFDAFKARLAADGSNIKTIEFRDRSGRLNGVQFQAPNRSPVRAGDLGEEFRTKNLTQAMSPTASPKSPTTTAAVSGTTKTAGAIATLIQSAADQIKRQQQAEQAGKRKQHQDEQE